jgi:L-threonylcarbamoyladenylate synthase
MRCRVTHDPAEAAAALIAGKIVALPTETVYGLAGNAFDSQVLAKIFAAKDRPEFDPLIVHIRSYEMLSAVVTEFPETARQLAELFWPGPLTMVLPKSSRVPDLATAGLPTVGVRWPSHPLMLQVLSLTGFPLAAPSANLFGRLSPTTVEHVLDQLGDRIDLALDGGPCAVGVESTVLQIGDDRVSLLRLGGVSVEEIESVTGPVQEEHASSPLAKSAPGQLPSHYAPRAPLKIMNEIPNQASHDGIGVLLPCPQTVEGYQHVECLSRSGDLTESAANFFPALHRLDHSGSQVILTKRFADVGLGRALNDRLQRAAAAFVQVLE